MLMCTAIRFNERYFGRTFDYEKSFGETLMVTPREKMQILASSNRYAMMGVGVNFEGTPMYFDGINEWGLTMAALNFPHFAAYRLPVMNGTNIPSGRLIAHVLGLCRSVDEACEMLGKITVTSENEEAIKSTPLHWIISDGRRCIVVESVAEGLKAYDNSVGVLTNSPELPFHLLRLSDVAHLSPRNPAVTTSEKSFYSRGMGAIGLPGDFSSSSRFVRAAFLKEYCFEKSMELGEWEINRTFDVLSSVSIPKGAVLSDDGFPVFTRYTAVIDMEKPSYCLTTASCRSVHKISLTDSLCNGKGIQRYSIYREENIFSLTES